MWAHMVECFKLRVCWILSRGSQEFLNFPVEPDCKAEYCSYSLINLRWVLTSEMLGTMDCLHFHVIINLAANRMCITMVLNLVGRLVIPKLRIASGREGFIMISVRSEMNEKTLFQKGEI